MPDEPIRESESAKTAGISPLFNEMISKVEKGVYDGIISWHPDRLARNMKEAGTIIDLVDKKTIRDLKFVSFDFSNTSSGKLLLGIIFVMSKEFSDKLSDDIKRGNYQSIVEGKYVRKSKHGYMKDKDGYMYPDGENFVILKEAWEMRLDDKTLEECFKYINTHEYKCFSKIGCSNKPFKFTARSMSTVFKDTFYAGTLTYGIKKIDLHELYDFEPMVAVEDFLKLNHLKSINVHNRINRGTRKGQRLQNDFLRGMVNCGYCNRKLYNSVTRKHTILKTGIDAGKEKITRYHKLRCRNPECSFFNNSVPPRIIIDFFREFVKKYNFINKNTYEHFISETAKESKEKLKKFTDEERIINNLLINLRPKLEQFIKSYSLESDDSMKALIKPQIEDLRTKIIKLEVDLKEIKDKKENIKISKTSYNQFVELYEKMVIDIDETKDLKRLEYYMKKWMSNFTASKQKVLGYELNSPFKEFYEMANVQMVEMAGVEPASTKGDS